MCARANIVNPARLDATAAVDVCVQCHSEDQSPTPIDGLTYHWPVGFQVGRRLSEFWRLEPHTLGQTGGLHFGDGPGRENRMQGAPAMAERLKMPDPCTTCHTDKASAWATEVLRSWPEFSPWRVGP